MPLNFSGSIFFKSKTRFSTFLYSIILDLSLLPKRVNNTFAKWNNFCNLVAQISHKKISKYRVNLKTFLCDLNSFLFTGIPKIYYIVLSETRKNWVVTMKTFNIVVLKNLDATSRGSIFMKWIKIPRAESCDVKWLHHCLHKKLGILYLFDYAPKPLCA